MNKQQRQHIIISLIHEHKISSQEELLQLLINKKITITQATLSRDLKELMASRMYDADYGMIYTTTFNVNATQLKEGTLNKNILSIDFSGNLCVVKTLPGYASAIAMQIDQLKSVAILGTIAGDDTILVIIKQQIKQTTVKQLIYSIH